jgi:hypothetical protein
MKVRSFRDIEAAAEKRQSVALEFRIGKPKLPAAFIRNMAAWVVQDWIDIGISIHKPKTTKKGMR